MLAGTKTRGCTHLYQFDVDRVLEEIRPCDDRSLVSFSGHEVRMNSIRYKCFARSRVCSQCGRVGTVMMLDQFKDERPHFNLYAVENGELILMTRDHIVPLSKGGFDILDNLQTLCVDCNHLKADQ